MIRYTTIALAAVTFLFAGQAFAETMSGTLASWDDNANTITLTDGTVFHLASTVKKEGLTAGRDVTVTYTTQNGQHEASTVEVVK